MKQNNEKTTLRGKNGNRNAAIRKKSEKGSSFSMEKCIFALTTN